MKRSVFLLPLLILLTSCAPDGSGITWEDVAFVGVVGSSVCGLVLGVFWIATGAGKD